MTFDNILCLLADHISFSLALSMISKNGFQGESDYPSMKTTNSLSF
jgi:hypothetical protein